MEGELDTAFPWQCLNFTGRPCRSVAPQGHGSARLCGGLKGSAGTAGGEGGAGGFDRPADRGADEGVRRASKYAPSATATNALNEIPIDPATALASSAMWSGIRRGIWYVIGG